MATGSRASVREAAKKSGRSPSKIRWLWRFPFESRLAAWSLLVIALIGAAAAIAVAITMSVGRHHCADLCLEREYAFKDYAPASRFGTRPPVCTCSKGGVPIEVPMR